MSNEKNFVIKQGVLTKYTGPGGDVVIPDGVTSIGDRAFSKRRSPTSIVIPNSVTSIDGYAFSGCSSLKSIVIPDSVISIGWGAFSGCSSLKSIVIPDSVTSIDRCAFSGCSSLTSIVIPGSVTSIAYETFEGCNNLANVEIVDGVTSIGPYAFGGCVNLTSIVIPGSVTYIYDEAFRHCSSLTSIEIMDGATGISCHNFADTSYYNNPANWENGILYIGNHLIAANSKHLSGAYTIRTGTKSIAGNAFENCNSLTSIVIPNSVTSIGREAFSGCSALKSIAVPDSVSIDWGAFSGCSSLKSIVIPDSVTSIDRRAFSGCSSLTSIVIPDSVTSIGDGAFGYCSRLTSITIPDSVTSIGEGAFYDCSSLSSITIPNSVTCIGEKTFCGCSSLISIEIPSSVIRVEKYAFGSCEMLQELTIANRSCKLGQHIFGDEFRGKLPSGLLDQVATLCQHMTDSDVQQYILDKTVWEKLDIHTQAKIFMTKQSEKLLAVYGKCVNDFDIFGKALLDQLSDKPSAKECSAMVNFIVLFSQKASPELIRQIYNTLKPFKTAAKALQTIDSDPVLAQILGAAQQSDVSLSTIEQKMLDILQQQKLSSDEPERRFRGYYSNISLNGLELKDKTGQPVPLMVTYWLMTAHETWDGSWNSVYSAYPNPGLCPEAESLVEELDPASLQSCLRSMATNLGMSGRSKKMFLAYPICRYADEAYMEELTKAARSWSSSVSGNNAPPLLTFRKASAYSNTRAAMLFADQYGDLEKYAKLRGTTEDVFRDRYLSDIGIDESGGKTYDLGIQSVTVRLQKDLSFLVELPNGKTAKTLPKKGADEEKYAIANRDFSEMKKAAKKIIKNRNDTLLKTFLSGKKQKASDWIDAYLRNPLLRSVASLLVWNQAGNTFTLKDGQPIDATGNPYAIGRKPITLAHPMEMQPLNVQQWQQYFAAHSLKQPFLQIWEPVVAPDAIREDRYAGIRIPYFRFMKQEKHGIHVEDYDFHNEIEISFEGCDAEVERLDMGRHYIDPNHCFEVTSFAFTEYTRQVNHIVGLLDKWTVYGRILKDDATIVNQLSQFTLAQIEEFLKLAMENNCTNCTAALLEFKNANFADFDPMAEFTLEL